MKDQCFREEEDSEVKVLIGPSSASGVVEIPDSEEEMELRVEICFNESPKENCIQSPTPKRKRMSGVVMSDTEEEPVYSELEKKKNMDVEVCLSTSTDFPVSDDEKTELRPRSRRRLVPLSQLRNGANSYSRKGGNFRQRLKVPVLQSRENDDEDEEPAGSESEGDSLDGFIESESNTFEDELSSNSGDVYSGRFFGRNHRGSSNMKWEYEGDMLASFGKDPVICMEAVCALYRQQTANEMSFKACLLCNNRGFNKIDARRYDRKPFG